MGSTAMHASSLSVFFALVVLFSTTSFELAQADLSYRLDAHVIPQTYNITIKPYLLPTDGNKQFTFEGEVGITLQTSKSDVREITLHKDYIEISVAHLYNELGNLQQTFSAEQLLYESATDKLSLILEQALQANRSYTLHFVYTGQIRSGLAGFFRASYTDADGQLKWLALTQLQRIDARTVFPCFDEPALKAKFRMHISRPKHYNSKFNTRLFSTELDGDDRYLDHFEETPLMSTYLVAFIVSDFSSRGDADFALITNPGYLNKTDFSYSVGRKALDAYSKYTRLPYKELGNSLMQMAGSPRFPHNGMENWGLVIYRDSVLVHEPGYSDGWSDKEYTITILVHETAHMWFGNSVTFAWWSYFWLNEAFARYYQYYLAHELYPEYQLDLQFVVNQVHLIFGTDAVNTTQPMTSPEDSVQTPTEIGRKFSSIAYAKGAAIVRMIRNLMGHDNFDNAMHDYLQENHLKNVAPEQLFVHLKRNWPTMQKVDLDQFFYDWTEQVGFPILFVDLSVNKRTVVLRQTRFLLNTTDGSDSTLRYTIPITYTTDTERYFENLAPQFYFNKSEEEISWQLEKSANWIIFNLQQSNYHRVLYDASTFRSIKQALVTQDHGGIHVTNRAQLVDDLFNFGRVGLLEYDAVFEFMEYLAYETEYLPWYAAFSGLQRISQRLSLEQQANFGVFIRDITQQVYEKLGFERANDTVLDVYNRNKVISWLSRYNHDECNEHARSTFMAGVEAGVKPAPDFRETLYCSAIRFGEFNYYLKLQELYAQENATTEQELLLRAMACTYHFAEFHYARVLSDTIPQNYKLSALTPLYSKNPENVTPVFQMIMITIERLADALGSWSSAANVISDISSYFTTDDQKRLLEDFIEKKGALFGASQTTLHSALQKVENNLQWADTRLGPLLTYLQSRQDGATTASLASALLILMAVLYLIV